MGNAPGCTQSPADRAPPGHRLARKLTRLSSEGFWTEKVKIVKYHVLRCCL